MADLEEIRGELGQLYISDKALEMIAYGALQKIEGLYTPDRVKGAGLLESISKAYQGSGIQILKVPVAKEGEAARLRDRREGTAEKEEEKLLKIKLALVAKYGMPIHAAAEQAIRNVRRKIKELAGLEVGEVEVEITGIVKMP